jgi:AMP nucleosidase
MTKLGQGCLPCRPGAANILPMTVHAEASAIIDQLVATYEASVQALRHALAVYLETRQPPSAEQRRQFCYPELRVLYRPEGAGSAADRFFVRFPAAGSYATTITQPQAFRPYLSEQLESLIADYGAQISVGLSATEIPYPYVLDGGDELAVGDVPPYELARHFPTPVLSNVGDEIADGQWRTPPGMAEPLSLFDAVRTDYSLKRLVHYTGTDWRHMQPWILFTNYHRYVDEFIRWAIQQLHGDTPFVALSASGGVYLERGRVPDNAFERIAGAPWRRHQMPAYHLITRDGQGITLVNIGVGPSNAKNITDHLAVLRPHCWLMIGHCGGLRQEQRIGDYVLAHGYLRLDKILDHAVPPDVPVPALAEVQQALQRATAHITGDAGLELKQRLRTGTVVTYDDRNWELRFSAEAVRFNQSRAVGVDMESGTIAAQGYRFRVPYGTLLCVSDKPLHGEIKLPGAANSFYERAIGEHLLIGLESLRLLQQDMSSLHSRKLRSFDEPPFR